MTQIYLISPPAGEPRKSYPYSLVYLSSYLKKHDMECEIIDCDVMGYTAKGISDYLYKKNASIIGITGYSRYRFAAYETARAIKKKLPNCTIIAGGRHFSALAEETLENIQEIDIVVRGEGEVTFKEICEKLNSRDTIDNVDGITYRNGNKIVSTPDRKLEKDIEKYSYRMSDLPDGPYHLKEKVSLLKTHEIVNPISVMTSRGCPGRCVYCCLSAGFVRYRDPVLVVEEIQKKMKSACTNELGISDSSFTVNKNHVMAICEEIMRKKLKIRWVCQSRVNIPLNLLKVMKQAGCVAISVGVESASYKVLKAIQKKINLGEVMDFLERCNQLNLSVLTYFMVSLPDENEEDAEETFRFIKEIKPLIFKPAMQIAQIYPDAKLYYMAKEKNLLPENFDWFNLYSNPHVKDLGGRENIPFYIEKLDLNYLKNYMNRYKKYYFKHFYYRGELKTNIIQGMNALLFDWENESIYRKFARIKNGFRAVYSNLNR